MKKTRLLCFSLAILGVSLSAQTSKQWSIQGTFEDQESLPASLSLAAFSFPSESFEPVANIKVDPNGQFQWSAPFEIANLYQLTIGEQSLRLAIDTMETVLLTIRRDGDQWAPSIKGSKGTKMMYEFPKKLREREAFYFGDLKQEMESAMKEKDEATLAKIQEQVGQLFPKFVADLESMLEYLGSSTAVYGALDYIDPNKGQAMIEQTILRMQAEKPHIPITRSLVERLAKMKGIPIGAEAPAFQGIDLKGKDVQLSHYAGKYLYIDFWASWCLACRVEHPKLVELYNAYQAEDFAMLGIGVKDKESAWKAAIAKDKLPWSQVNDKDGRIASAYFVMSLPQNVLLDPAGKILHRNLSPEELSEVLQSILGDN